MRRALFVLVVISGSLGLADPRPKPSDYPAHAASATLAIGAEYLVHSFSNGRQTFLLPGYLVVDAAVYPQSPLTLRQSHFKLVLNGQTALAPQDARMVGFSLKSFTYLDSGQSNSGGGQFPGDTRGSTPQPPAQAPDPAHPERDPVEPAEKALERTALPEGDFHAPLSGFLYFPFEGKTKKIKSLDLVYSGPAGDLTVKLF